MYEIEAACHPTEDGLVFLPVDLDAADERGACILRAHFQPMAHYPAEPDVGCGDSFDVDIEAVELVLPRVKTPLPLGGKVLKRAKDFLNEHYGDQVWETADQEAAEHFGVAL